jgi:hypothetical protein
LKHLLLLSRVTSKVLVHLDVVLFLRLQSLLQPLVSNLLLRAMAVAATNQTMRGRSHLSSHFI